jgi:hypothetical protein
MVKSRDTSRKEAGMSPRGPERLFLPVEFDGANREWAAILAWMRGSRGEEKERKGKSLHRGLGGHGEHREEKIAEPESV